MRRWLKDMMLDVLAAHLEVPVGTLKLDDRLKEDLGIPPLGLVLICLDIEDIEGVSLPIERLVRVKTVRELGEFLEKAIPPPLAPSKLRAVWPGEADRVDAWPE